ncbi:hypothetical protein B9Z47_06030 [Limnohabitans sp. 2KL-1]|jgi:glycosyltransferase involved in cell wall biosynthesis|uniref:glycosyltransferase n=1 Tax=Limnohabitans sp. 2KL-1 TaxID=1100699 RepID=UPI000D378755|nr:glycosyltransferase [Limnohabitans sp. 2KL-1]PUE49060.1 hypothetical protein B9Z47_06030 [Limnohabitans sp. 2KL-1]
MKRLFDLLASAMGLLLLAVPLALLAWQVRPGITGWAQVNGRNALSVHFPGCRETVVDGDNGFLVPVQSVDALAEAMARFITDPTLAARMGQRGRQLAEDKYDVHKVNAVMLKEMGLG